MYMCMCVYMYIYEYIIHTFIIYIISVYGSGLSGGHPKDKSMS